MYRWGYVGPRFDLLNAQYPGTLVPMETRKPDGPLTPTWLRVEATRLALAAYDAGYRGLVVDGPAWQVWDVVEQVQFVDLLVAYIVETDDGLMWYVPSDGDD